MPIYDLQTDIPGFYESRMPFTERLNRILETNPEMIEMLLSPVPPPPYPGAKDILRWQTHMVRQRCAHWHHLATAPCCLPLNMGASALPHLLWQPVGSGAVWRMSHAAQVSTPAARAEVHDCCCRCTHVL